MHYKMMTLAMVSAVLCAGSVLAAEPPLQMNRAERAALRTSSVSVAQAISIAEAQGHGRVTNIVSRPRGDRDVYHVTLFADGRLRAGRVDGLTGTFTPDEMLGRPGHAELRALDGAKQSIGNAVRIAQSYRGGKAGDAGLEAMRTGKYAYEVRVLRNGGFHDVWVDSGSGKVLHGAVV